MPYLKVRLNREVTSNQGMTFIKSISQKVAKFLNKPESYVMVELETNPMMIFAGNQEPAAYLELKSIGLADVQIPALSKHLCAALEEEFEIASTRIYIEFTDIKGMHWGWNGSTF